MITRRKDIKEIKKTKNEKKARKVVKGSSQIDLTPRMISKLRKIFSFSRKQLSSLTTTSSRRHWGKELTE
jgi:isopentenyl phosphate kinase